MKIRGVDIDPILDASGVRGFFDDNEYKHHKFLKPLGLTFNGSVFVTKTTTWGKNIGHMPMQKDGITPAELTPRCILPNLYYGNIALSWRMFLEGIMLNAVGLSGPGAEALFEDGRWQKRTSPFWISFMSNAKTPEERVAETGKFAEMFKHYLPGFKAKVGWQINCSCPNLGMDPASLIDETKGILQAASIVDVPRMLKFNALAPIWPLKEISNNQHCDALCVSNTIPFDKLCQAGIDPVKLFGTYTSPLAEFGGGGLSGKPLLREVGRWVNKARLAGITIPIIAGGGILRPQDVRYLKLMGASSVFMGSAANLRPWMTRYIIREAHKIFGKGDEQ